MVWVRGSPTVFSPISLPVEAQHIPLYLRNELGWPHSLMGKRSKSPMTSHIVWTPALTAWKTDWVRVLGCTISQQKGEMEGKGFQLTMPFSLNGEYRYLSLWQLKREEEKELTSWDRNGAYRGPFSHLLLYLEAAPEGSLSPPGAPRIAIEITHRPSLSGGGRRVLLCNMWQWLARRLGVGSGHGRPFWGVPLCLLLLSEEIHKLKNTTAFFWLSPVI